MGKKTLKYIILWLAFFALNYFILGEGQNGILKLSISSTIFVLLFFLFGKFPINSNKEN